MKLFHIFKQPSAEVLAQRELEEARRQLLAAQSAAEYAHQMASYHSNRIDRLSRFVTRNTPTHKAPEEGGGV